MLRFDKAIEINKNFIMERRLDFDLGKSAEFEGVFDVMVTLVKEFYSNLHKTVDNKVRVNGC